MLDRAATVALTEITAKTVRAVIALEVSEHQRGYVASNATSIAEAHFTPGAWFRAITADERPVGFVMLFDPTALGAVPRSPMSRTDMGLWRLMVDWRCQRLELGRRALDLVREQVIGLGGFERLLELRARPGRP